MKNNIPLPQPKYIPSPRLKALNRKVNELKKGMGIKGKVKTGDLIQKAGSLKKKVGIMGLI